MDQVIEQGAEEDRPDELLDALMHGKTTLAFRYRFEGADLAAFPEKAWASTLRTALGYETGKYRGVSGYLEFESIDNVLGDSYNDTVNGKTSRAVVADPDSTEVNQAYLRAEVAEGLQVRAGRQEIALGNHRFIGSVPWRQNHQSFDAVRGLYSVNEALTIDYALAVQVNRIFGDQSPVGDEQLRAHFLDARYDGENLGRFAAYLHLIDFDNSATLSSQTVGVRAENNHVIGEDAELGWTAEYARQEDAADNPIQIDQDYFLVEGWAKAAGFQLTLASETLGGSGQPGDKFSTPFATLHKFNGFADVFLATPDSGLEDRYVRLSKSFKTGLLEAPIAFSATYHEFHADAGGTSYGSELDLNALAPLSPKSSVRTNAIEAQFTWNAPYSAGIRVVTKTNVANRENVPGEAEEYRRDRSPPSQSC